MPGPVLDVQLSPSIGNALTSNAQKARAAAAEYRALEAQLVSAARLGNVPQQLAEQLKVVKGRADELKRMVREQREDYHRFKGMKEVYKYGGHLGGLLASGGLDIYSAAELLRSPHTRKVLKAVGLGNAAGVLGEGIMKAAPAIFAAHQLYNSVQTARETQKSDKNAFMDLREKYLRGEVSYSTYLQGAEISDWYSVGHNLGLTKSRGEKINELLEQGESLGDPAQRERYKVAATAAIKRDTTDLAHRIEDLNRTSGGSVSEKDVHRWFEEARKPNVDVLDVLENADAQISLRRQRDTAEYGVLSPSQNKRITDDVFAELRKTHPAFVDEIKRLDEDVKAARLDAMKIKREPTMRQKYDDEIDKLSRRALFNEYKRGYVPFYRTD